MVGCRNEDSARFLLNAAWETLAVLLPVNRQGGRPMQIINDYDYHGIFTDRVFWRTFGAWDDSRAFGLTDGNLSYREAVGYDRSDFFQLEFKEANAIGTMLVGAGPIFSRHCGDLALDSTGHAIAQSAPPWNLPRGRYTEWMADETIQNKTLFDLTLPYTHDSGAYRLGPRMYADSKSSDLPEALAKAYAIGMSLHLQPAEQLGELIKRFCLAQSRTIEEQLNDGIRGLDLRVVTINEGLNTGHGMIGEPIVYILQKIRQFLEQTSRELVVLTLGVGSTTDTASQQRLTNLVRSTFGDRIAPVMDLQSTKVRDITQGRSRVIVIGPGFRPETDLGFSLDWWINTDDPKHLMERDVALVKTHQSAGQWSNPSWTLTPQINPILDEVMALVRDILEHLYDKDRVAADLQKLITVFARLEGSTLIELARKVNPRMKGVIDGELGPYRINLLSCDHYQESPIVDIAVARSLRTPASV
jgi:hypothetical protein